MPDDQAFFTKTRTQKYWDLEKREEIGFITWDHEDIMRGKQLVCNKAKGKSQNGARQIFRKTNISYPLIRKRTCACQALRNVRFSENLACFVFLKDPFRDSPFYLLLTNSE